VIILTRLGGHEMAVNPDLIERADRTPDTVLTMADGHKLVVAESLTELVTRVRHWRASIAADAFLLARGEAPTDDADGVSALAELTAADAVPHSVPSSAMARVVRMPTREG
jgi:flagellar protein FlbD